MSLCRRTDVSELNSTKINVKCSTAFDIWPLIDRTASFYSLWFNTIDNPLGGVMVSVVGLFADCGRSWVHFSVMSNQRLWNWYIFDDFALRASSIKIQELRLGWLWVWIVCRSGEHVNINTCKAFVDRSMDNVSEWTA